MISKLFCSVLSNRMTSHMQVIGLEAQCGFMPGKSTVDAIFTMRVSLQKRFRFQKDTWVLFVALLRHLTPCLGRCSSTGPKLPFRTTLPGYCQGAGMRGVSPDRKQGANAWSGAVSGYDFKLIVTGTG